MSADSDVSVRRSALLALGEFDENGLALTERERLTSHLIALYREDPDPGVHASSGWLLGHWGQQALLAKAKASFPQEKPSGVRRWYLTAQGQTMAIIPPGTVRRGEGRGREEIEVDHRFALAACEVTVAEFRCFRGDYVHKPFFSLTQDCPVNDVSWYDAAAYCNWLSQQEGIPKEEWCYLPNDKGEYASGMKVAPISSADRDTGCRRAQSLNTRAGQGLERGGRSVRLKT